ncbi:hypothetical protein C1645_817543 [Glomus cerebriforme]|uniref:Uncharacterized protein n=1 Tax=Glomus cerebriforme TaxID=658196 RepID=A0A397TER2_9GLOM|nr:hypothetical protein C1645_817543 [Glomus cerebriforme]
MSDNDEFFNFLRRADARGLVLINDPSDVPVVITSLECVIPDEYYQISALHLIAIKREVFWMNVEDKAIEDETLSANFKQLLGKECIGVACSPFFPEKLKNKSINEIGLAVVYPGGNRFKVEVPENLF